MFNLQSNDVLTQLVPHHLKQDPFLAALTKGVSIQISKAYKEAYDLTDFLHFVITSESLLDVIAFEKMVDYYFSLTIEEKRELIRNSRELKMRKGTVFALEKVLEILSFQGVVDEWFDYGGTRGHFKIAVDLSARGTTEGALTLLDRLVDEYKRKSSHLDTIYIYLTSPSNLYHGVTTQVSETIEMNF